MRYLLLVATLVGVTACSQEPPPPAPAAKPQATFADPQIQAYDKAKDVQNVLDKADQQQRKDINSQGE